MQAESKTYKSECQYNRTEARELKKKLYGNNNRMR